VARGKSMGSGQKQGARKRAGSEETKLAHAPRGKQTSQPTLVRPTEVDEGWPPQGGSQ
jgi:hypothetical protein